MSRQMKKREINELRRIKQRLSDSLIENLLLEIEVSQITENSSYLENKIKEREKCVSDLNNSVKCLVEEIEELKKENQSLREENYNLKNRGIFKRLLNA